jgi:hypothetical protein
MEKREFLTLPGLELRPLDRSALSQSLYRLRYTGSYSSPLRRNVRAIQSRRIIWVGHIPYKGEMRNRYRILAGKSPDMLSIGGLGHKWEAVANTAV